MSQAGFIPFHRPSIGPEELEAVRHVLLSHWLTTGPVAMQFERDFAEFIGSKHAVAVSSATAALQLALKITGIGPGDEVLVPTYTFTATAAVVRHCGARPVLCDVSKDGFNIDATDLSQRITKGTRAAIPVHIAGLPCDIFEIHRISRRYGFAVIEDAAHALPAAVAGHNIGTTSALTGFSFHATKTVTAGEGGMLVTNEDDFAEQARTMRLHGIRGDAWKRYAKEGSWHYDVVEAGYKMNMPDVLAAIGSAQLAKCLDLWQRRMAIARKYTEAFASMDELQLPPQPDDNIQHSWHLYILRLRPEMLGITRSEFIEELKKLGIGTSVHYIPLHLHSFYQRTYGYRGGDFPNAEDAYSRCLSLPIFPDMTDAEVERVIRSVQQIVGEHRIHSLPIAA
jgi:dTDP-4-amino-4,6-dideoxygalactose transaminase